MDVKYTKDGKKVAVLGKLNNETWIVQEIYVNESGQELPCGENFTEKTLLDEPASTWESRHAKELEERTSNLKQKIEKLEKEATIIRRKSDVARLINYANKEYQNIDISELDTLFAFLSGQITHVVTEKYSDYEIIPLIDATADIDNHGSWLSIDGLKLVSLFGCRANGERGKSDRTFSLKWRINQYRDGSGGWTTIHPCCSQEEAVSLLDEFLSKECATENRIKLKEKYGLNNPSQDKIYEYKNRCIESKKESIEKAKEVLKKREDELQKLTSALPRAKEQL